MSLIFIPCALSRIPCARTRARGVASWCMIAANVRRWLSVRGRTYRTIITPEVSVPAAQALHTMSLVWGRYLTKKLLLQHLVTAHDVGVILNPLTHQGQIEGGLMQGLGYALMEELRTAEGQIATLSLGEYKVPTIKDIPELVTVLLEPAPGPAPYEGKGIGESSNTPVAAALANAICDAVGVRVVDLPLTAEKIFAALQTTRRG